jgi:aminomethyltransferase
VDLEQKADFIGKEALARINAEGISQRLLGGVIDGERMTRFNENFWPVYVSDRPAGHLTVCVYSPRLKQNLAFIMIKAEFASAGQLVEIHSPDGSMNATLCELPFISERQK